jgi:holo-[acyl-carrier protein] synthase
MVIGIGCDIVEHKITKGLNWDTDETVLNWIFSQKELEIYHSKKDIKFLSGRFAVKEAVLKCLGTGMRNGISLTDIHVLKSSAGVPTLELTGAVKEISESLRISNWFVSISHSAEYSMAVVVAES